MKYAKLLSLFLVVAMVCALFAACGGSGPMKDAEGTYQGKYTKLVGDETKNEDEEFSIELKADGTGTHRRDGLELKITWTLDGENVTMQETFLGITLDYTGTLKNGELHLFNGDPTDIWTYEYVYQKQ